MNAASLVEQPDMYFTVAALLLAIGVFGLLRRRTLIGMLISGELIFSGASLNLMAFNRFKAPDPAIGQIFKQILLVQGRICESFVISGKYP